MKRILLFSAVLLGLSAQAQFSFDADSVAVIGDKSEFELYKEIEVTNISNNAVNIKVDPEMVYMNPEAALKYCFGEFCYNSLEPTYEGVLDSQESAMLKAQYNPFETEDWAEVHYFVSDAGTPGSTRVIKVFYDTRGSSVTEDVFTDSYVSDAYPNPAKDQVRFSYRINNSYTDAFVEVRSLTGAVVDQIEISGTQGVAELNLEAFHSGAYFYSLVVDGVPSITQRLIVNK